MTKVVIDKISGRPMLHSHQSAAEESLLWYGYERDITSRSKIPIRIGNNDLHRSLPIQNKIARYVENLDGTVKYWTHPNNALLRWDNGQPAKLDGTDGNLMLYKPGFYFRAEMVGNKYRKMYSESPLTGFTYMPPEAISWVHGTYDNVNNRAAAVCSLVFDASGNIVRDGNGLPTFTANAAQFRGGSNNATLDGTKTSHIGQARSNVTKADVRVKCAAIGANFGAYSVMNQLAGLYTLEYANYDAQEAFNPTLDANGFAQGGIGSGTLVDQTEWNNFNAYYGFVPEGLTAKLGNKTGVVDYVIKDWTPGIDKTVQVSSWRGLEKWFAYMWLMADDLLIYHQSDVEGALSKAYVCNNPLQYANPANDNNPAVPAGYIERTLLPRTSGYGLLEALNQYGDMLLSSSNGSANEGLCDNYWRSGEGWFQGFLSGAGYYSTSCGPRFLDTNYRSSDAYAFLTFRLGRKTVSGGI